jgi:hypothetical protein
MFDIAACDLFQESVPHGVDGHIGVDRSSMADIDGRCDRKSAGEDGRDGRKAVRRTDPSAREKGNEPVAKGAYGRVERGRSFTGLRLALRSAPRADRPFPVRTDRIRVEHGIRPVSDTVPG